MEASSWFVMPYNPKKLNDTGKNQISFPMGFAEKLILSHTKKGYTIFDPFAGYGTTLFAAQKHGRVGIGIEYDKKRYNYIKAKLRKPNQIIHGNSLNLDSLKLPKMDFLLTSPPYMRYFDKENPLANYTINGNYKNYLSGIGEVFSNIKKLMRKN